jgi:basic membrane protein A and related proteins
MQSVNPKATMRVVWVNSWYDPGKEREAALALASQGADVLTHHTDSPSAIQVAEEKKINAIGYHSDMSKYGPNAHLVAVTHNWGAYYTKVAEDVIAGKWKSDMVWGGVKDGFISLAGFKAIEADMKSGKFNPFMGPVVDQAGKEIVPAGKSLTDADLGKMDYYVKGLVGQLPKK